MHGTKVWGHGRPGLELLMLTAVWYRGGGEWL